MLSHHMSFFNDEIYTLKSDGRTTDIKPIMHKIQINTDKYIQILQNRKLTIIRSWTWNLVVTSFLIKWRLYNNSLKITINDFSSLETYNLMLRWEKGRVFFFSFLILLFYADIYSWSTKTWVCTILLFCRVFTGYASCGALNFLNARLDIFLK